MRYVVALTSEFNYLPYDKEDIIEALKSYSFVKTIKECYNLGMNNQPKVISFEVRPILLPTSKDTIESHLNEILGTKYVSIREKDF